MQAINIRKIAADVSIAGELVPIMEAVAKVSAVLHYRTEKARNRATILRSIVYTCQFEWLCTEAFLRDDAVL